ncbi:hypothetical protein BRC91_01795 [Halobacteriales archaeon QS_4_62_28]|nr:MAG: hypothetical protein BRC91_01795 [Halobacteriales archaeon QS_4_62_28]
MAELPRMDVDTDLVIGRESINYAWQFCGDSVSRIDVPTWDHLIEPVHRPSDAIKAIVLVRLQIN